MGVNGQVQASGHSASRGISPGAHYIGGRLHPTADLETLERSLSEDIDLQGVI